MHFYYISSQNTADMTKKESIEQFLAPRKLAIAGVSRNSKKFGNMIFKELIEKGFDVCPINPKAEEIEGVRCYKSITDIPGGYEKLLVATPKEQTDEAIAEAAKKGINHIWVQQMANTKETQNIARENNVELIDKECIFMFAEPVKGVHKFHQVVWKLFGLMPK